MSKLARQALAAACVLLAAAHATSAQCKDQLCQKMQDVLTSAQIDFRGYRSKPATVVSLATTLAPVTCQMNTWANNVPMYICYGQLPLAGGDSWFRATLDTLKRLQPTWQVKMNSSGDDQYVDAGPDGCEPTPNEGPYLGQCPAHMQMVKQPDGTTKLYLWINSYSSPYLMHHSPAPQPIRRAAANAPACDDFCQSFKKVFTARADSFSALRPAEAHDEVDSSMGVHFEGARKCTFTRAATALAEDPSSDSPAQFVCYWSESSATAAEARFRTLISRVQSLLPGWPTNERTETDDVTGAPRTIWSTSQTHTTQEDVRIFQSGTAISLHITASPSGATPAQ